MWWSNVTHDGTVAHTAATSVSFFQFYIRCGTILLFISVLVNPVVDKMDHKVIALMMVSW